MNYIKYSEQLPQPIGSIQLSFNNAANFIALRIIPRKIHMLFDGHLHCVWNFSKDILDLEYLHHLESVDYVSLAVLTTDGCVWKIDTETGHSRIDTPEDGIPYPKIYTANHEHILFCDRNARSILPHTRLSSRGFLIYRSDKTFAFRPLERREDSPNIHFGRYNNFLISGPSPILRVHLLVSAAIGIHPSWPSHRLESSFFTGMFGEESTPIVLAGTDTGMVYFMRLGSNDKGGDRWQLLTILSEPIQSLHSCTIRFTRSHGLFAVAERERNDHIQCDNALLIVGHMGSLVIFTSNCNSAHLTDNNVSIIHKEYHISERIISSLVADNLLLICTKDGNVDIVNLIREETSDDMPEHLYVRHFLSSEKIVKLIGNYVASDYRSISEIYALAASGRVLSLDLQLYLSSMFTHIPGAVKEKFCIKKAIKNTISEISECTLMQNGINEQHQHINTEIVHVNEIIQNIKYLRDLVMSNLHLTTDWTKSHLRDFLVIHVGNLSIKVRMNSSSDIDWDRWTLTANLIPEEIEYVKISTHNRHILGFSFVAHVDGLIGAKSFGEHRITIEDRFLKVPAKLQLSLLYHPYIKNIPKSRSKSGIPEPILFPICDIRIDILDFIAPCYKNQLGVSKAEWEITSYGQGRSASRTFSPSQKDFFQHAVHVLQGSNERFPLDGFKEILTHPLDVVDFRDIVSIVFTLESLCDIDEDDAIFRRCLTVVLGGDTPEKRLRNIVVDSEHSVFTVPFDDDQVFLTLKKKGIEKSQNKQIVDLTIKCSSARIPYLVEEALLYRLNGLLCESSTLTHDGSHYHILKELRSIEQIFQGLDGMLDALMFSTTASSILEQSRKLKLSLKHGIAILRKSEGPVGTIWS